MKFDSLKLDSHSIKFKVGLYFILFAITLMVILWLLQVFFLNTFYRTMKISMTQRVTTDIEQAYEKYGSKKFLAQVEAIAESDDVYIYLTTENGTFGGSYTSSHRIYDYDTEIRAVQNKMTAERTNFVSMGVSKPDQARQTWACGKLLMAPGKKPMLVYVFAPLWPVSSTIEILTTQLIYVTIISLVLALVLALYLSNRISRPIQNITKSAKKLADGEYGITFRGGHYTELNNLASTLTQTSIALEKSTLLQKDLIANVSHDLRTPLTMVKSYAEMIRDLSGDNPEKRNAHLQVIIDEADRLNLLVTDMLTLSRMQSGALTLSPQTFDLGEALESIVLSYKLLMEKEGYHLCLNCSENLIVTADREKMKQVFSNLINNALKFCGEDKTVNITLKKKGRKILCQVEDHGVGIPQEELPHIWERYYRASSNMVRSTTGTGLGLSIVKEILTLHNANYGVNSTLGRGTTFWFELNTAGR